MRTLPLLLAALLAPATHLAMAAELRSPAVERALAAFSQWDADKNDHLTPEELDRAIASPEVKDEQAAAAVALRRVARSKEKPVADFTRDSIINLAPAIRFVDPRDEEETPEPERGHDARANLDRYYDAALRKIRQSPRALFVGAPSLDGFRQGRLGTCFSLAPLSAIAFSDPAAVEGKFRVAPDGSVTVTFGADNAVTVAPLTDGEVAMGTDTGGNGLWAATYEKAVGELRRASASSPELADATPYAVATRGGSAGTMLSVLTGRAIKRFSCKAWLPGADTPAPELEKKLGELRDLLRSATAEKRLMTAGTSAKTRKVPSLSQNHAYAVLGYDAGTDLVMIRDPHGQDFSPRGAPGLENGYEVRRGIFRVPTDEVVRIMAGFAFQQAAPAKYHGYPRADPAAGPAL